MRMARIKVGEGQEAVYHIISRIVGGELLLGDADKVGRAVCADGWNDGESVGRPVGVEVGLQFPMRVMS